MGLLACTLVSLLLAGGGAAPKDLETVVQDDALFLHRSPAAVDASARRLAELGADRLRLTAGWSALAPRPRSRRVPPAPFDASDSRTYPHDAFRSLDTAVKAASTHGLKVMIDLAFWAPRWAVGPAVAEPGARAVLRRRRSFRRLRHRCGAPVLRRLPGPRPPLTAICRPSGPSRPGTSPTTRPSSSPSGCGRPAASGPSRPHIYRAMHNAAYDAIKRVSALDQVLVGGTASTGLGVPGKGGVPPLDFVRALACVDGRLRPLKVPECADYAAVEGRRLRPPSVLAARDAGHAFGRRSGDAPDRRSPRLGRLLDVLRRRGRLASPRGSSTPSTATNPGRTIRTSPSTATSRRRSSDGRRSWPGRTQTPGPWRSSSCGTSIPPSPAAVAGRGATTATGRPGCTTRAATPSLRRGPSSCRSGRRPRASGPRRRSCSSARCARGHGQRVVQVERQDPTTGAWSPVQTAGPACDERSPQFLTDKAGFFLRTAAAVGARPLPSGVAARRRHLRDRRAHRRRGVAATSRRPCRRSSPGMKRG